MEKYIKLEDVRALLSRLANEPRYQHTGETYYEGISAVSIELDTLPTIETVDQVLEAEWVPLYKGLLGTDYHCSNCGQWAEEGNSGYFDRRSSYCKNCGRQMRIREN